MPASGLPRSGLVHRIGHGPATGTSHRRLDVELWLFVRTRQEVQSIMYQVMQGTTEDEEDKEDSRSS